MGPGPTGFEVRDLRGSSGKDSGSGWLSGWQGYLTYTVLGLFVVIVAGVALNAYGNVAVNGSKNNTSVIEVSNATLERGAEAFMRGYVLDESAPIRIGSPRGTIGLATLESHPADVDTSHVLPEVPRGWGTLEYVETSAVASAGDLTSDLQSDLHQIDWWGDGYTQRQLQMLAEAKQAYVTTKIVDGGQEALVFLFYSDEPAHVGSSL